MNVGKLIDALGGAKEVKKITGMSGGRISQMRTKNKMPKSWLMFFENKYPDAVHVATEDAELQEKQKKTLICLKNNLLLVGDAISDNFFTRLENAHEVKQSNNSISERIEKALSNTAELKKIEGSLKIPNSSIDFSIDF